MAKGARFMTSSAKVATVSLLGILSACSHGFPADHSPTEGVSSPTSRIFIAGDSTAADYGDERAPQIGWGQTLRYFAVDPDLIQNRAVNGRSTLSFVTEGRWQSLVRELQPGDTVLISFGHNDSKAYDESRFADAETDYRTNLERFARDVQAKQAVPVILSSAERRLWEASSMVGTHGLYPANAERAAAATGAIYIDLTELSRTYFEGIGREETKRDFLWLLPNPGHVRFPEGVEDNTHFTELGGCGLARIIAVELAQEAGLSDSFRKARLAPVDTDADGRPDTVEVCAEAVREQRK